MKKKYDTSQLLNFVEGSYLERTSRPVYALVFLLPFIVVYELGTILINTNVLRQYWPLSPGCKGSSNTSAFPASSPGSLHR
jgi:hypothetical protein